MREEPKKESWCAIMCNWFTVKRAAMEVPGNFVGFVPSPLFEHVERRTKKNTTLQNGTSLSLFEAEGGAHRQCISLRRIKIHLTAAPLVTALELFRGF